MVTDAAAALEAERLRRGPRRPARRDWTDDLRALLGLIVAEARHHDAARPPGRPDFPLPEVHHP